MKHTTIILTFLLARSVWAADSSNLAQSVNTYWVAEDYQALIGAIDAALHVDPHDIFALCLKHGYYMSVEEDFDKAKESSARLVAEVDSRIKNAKGTTYDLAKALSITPRPEITPPENLIDEKKLAYRHKESPDKFPFIDMYLWFSNNFYKYGEKTEESQQ